MMKNIYYSLPLKYRWLIIEISKLNTQLLQIKTYLKIILCIKKNEENFHHSKPD